MHGSLRIEKLPLYGCEGIYLERYSQRKRKQNGFETIKTLLGNSKKIRFKPYIRLSTNNLNCFQPYSTIYSKLKSSDHFIRYLTQLVYNIGVAYNITMGLFAIHT